MDTSEYDNACALCLSLTTIHPTYDIRYEVPGKPVVHERTN